MDLPPPYLDSVPKHHPERILPSYAQREHDISTRFARTQQHNYTSAHMHVILDSPESHFRLPTYGMGAIITGSVELTSKLDVRRVDVKVC